MPVTYIPRGKTTAETYGEEFQRTLENLLRILSMASTVQGLEQQQTLAAQKQYAEPYKIATAEGPEKAIKEETVTWPQLLGAERAYGTQLTRPVPETMTVTPGESEAGGLPAPSVESTALYRRPGGILSPETGQLTPTWRPPAQQEGLFARAIRGITGAPAPTPPAEVMPRAATSAEKARIAANQMEEMKANILARLPADKIEQVVYSQLGLTMSPAKREELETRESLELRKATVKEMLQEQKKFLTAQGQAASVLRGGFITDPQTGVQRPLTNIEITEHLQRIYDKDDPIETATGKLEQFAKKPALSGVQFPTPTEMETREVTGLVPGVLGKDVANLTSTEQNIYLRGQKAGLLKVDESGKIVYEKQAPLPEKKLQAIPSLITPGGHDILLGGERGKMPQLVGTAPPAATRETLHEAKQSITSTVNKQITELDKRHGIVPGVTPSPQYFEDYYNTILEGNRLFLERFGEKLPLYDIEKSNLKKFVHPQLRSYIEEQIQKGVKSPADIVKKLTSIPTHQPGYSTVSLFTPAEIANEINSILAQKAATTPTETPIFPEIGERFKKMYKRYLAPKPWRRKDESSTYYPY